MNKEVILKDGILYVKDHMDNEKEIQSLDNLDEILIQENIVEVMEKVINALQYSSDAFNKGKLFNLSIPSLPMIGTISLPTLMMYLNTGSLNGYVNTEFGVMEKNKFLALFITFFLPFAYSMSKTWYGEYKEELKYEKGRLLTLYYLKDNLTYQKERLNKLRSESKVTPVNIDSSYELDEDKIVILEEHINLYYELGYNINEYYNFYMENGYLPEELTEEYNEDGLRIIEEYLRSNGNKIKKMKRKTD